MVANQERLEEIIKWLNRKKKMSISELCQRLYCSKSTVRRYLIELEKNQLVRRYRGGVSLSSKYTIEFAHHYRASVHVEAKNYIAGLATDFITFGQSLFLDSSSTVSKLCPYLSQYNDLVVVTNGLTTAAVLADLENVTVFMTGGEIKKHSTSVVGEFSSAFLKNFRADTVFMSCRGLDEDGIYEADSSQAMVKQQMMKNAKQTVLLCDDSKFDCSNYYALTGYDDIDSVITNQQPNSKYMDLFKKYNCDVLC
ncbi:MAG: DeoR/GlpR family DNA-binding transcription regulator [Sporolactobacillus sp.]|nr:DeoR/GlpR family DNA-binding transcription regulator [Sporolactobacillus sp.]